MVVALTCCQHGFEIVWVNHVQCGAGLASGLIHRGEWPRSVLGYPMELGLSGADVGVREILCALVVGMELWPSRALWRLLGTASGCGMCGIVLAMLVAQVAMGAIVLG